MERLTEAQISEQLALARLFGHHEAIEILEAELTRRAEKRFPGCSTDSDPAIAQLFDGIKAGDPASTLFATAIIKGTIH